MTYKYESLTMDDLEACLRKAGSIWFRNDDYLLLEELLRRANKTEKRQMYSIVEDGDTLQIRASISNAQELAQLIEKLETRRSGWKAISPQAEAELHAFGNGDRRDA